MLTDWVLIRRLAHELRERLRGARVEDAGLLADGRIAILFRTHRMPALLAVDLFASPPLVTLESGVPAIFEEPGFARALRRSLRGTALADIAARRDDRLLRLSFETRSRFGVSDRFECYLELVPRFGNAVLVKGDRVVAARKEFAPSENPRRALQAGGAYVLPPIPPRARVLDARGAEAGDDEPLYVYRRDDRLLQAYVTPLDGLGDVQRAREASLLDVFAELRTQQLDQAGDERRQQRARAIARRLEERERKLRAELAALAQKRERAGARDALREEGEHIYGGLHALDGDEREAAKDRAAKLFAEYKKLGNSLPHVDSRERDVGAALEAIEMMRWELERARDEDLDDVEAAAAQLLPRLPVRKGTKTVKQRRTRLEVRTEGGSRIVVGRSPAENAELTFRLARPNDLWFHARGIPGAHVILMRDDRSEAPDADLDRAASLAAYYSRGRAGTTVPVDFTLRKYVRKRPNAPPGLVWYTQAKTVLTRPQPLESVT
jgi:predicted ribosome quality control (RQC) complex YloA/Tae2 family protein